MKIVTISREFGSGGRELGKRLADELGFAYYDKEIISKIAENLEMDEHYIEQILDRGFTINYPYTFRRSLTVQVYAQNQTAGILAEQHKVIRLLAEKGDAVMVGRNADIILHSMQPYRIFVYADIEAKMERCRQRATSDEKMCEYEMERRMKVIDKSRSASHVLLSNYCWGDRRAYELCVNTTGVEISEIVPPFAMLAKQYFEREKK
ncbi:MAG: cytidylate kinase-like family protein [Candidatus Gastranaerophilales bacterium]|nr:cytidylate kinase-like family protein [Candidatus Gastranaerophilales bacterium]